MYRRALEFFACPNCGGQLQLERAGQAGSSSEEVREGQLGCAGCSARFPIVRSLPRFVPSEAYAASFGYQWNTFDRIQLDQVMRNDLSRERFYATTGWPARLEGEKILEAGCGAGRFTELVAETGAEIFSFDLSNAVEANFKNHGQAKNAHIFQADIYRIPLRKGIFDKVYCMGVLQHCPDVKRAFLSLVPYLKPGGEIVIDVYQKNRFVPALKYWVRPFVRSMRTETIHKLLSMTIPPAFELKKALYKVPVVGKPVGNLIPIGPVSHKPKLDYTDEELKQVKILSALDMLAPVHDHPQTLDNVRAWCQEAGLADIEVRTGFNGINARGRKPVAEHDRLVGSAR